MEGLFGNQISENLPTVGRSVSFSEKTCLLQTGLQEIFTKNPKNLLPCLGAFVAKVIY